MKLLSKRQAFRIGSAIHLCISEANVNPLVMYCSVTGRPIGRLDEGIIHQMLEDIPAEMDNEELVDDLVIRTVSSMRPSPAWNYVDRNSLKAYVKSRPDEVLSYCLIRLYQTPDQLKLEFARRLENYQFRIRVYQLCNELIQRKFDISEWLYLLIEIDAMYNLTTMLNPKIDILSALVELDSAERFEQWMVGWRAWHEKLYESYEKKQRAALKQDQWLKGNSGAQSARLSMFMEAKPKSEATIKREKKAEQDNEMTNLLRALMEGTHNVKPLELKPIKIPGLIPPGGLKFNLAKKG